MMVIKKNNVKLDIPMARPQYENKNRSVHLVAGLSLERDSRQNSLGTSLTEPDYFTGVLPKSIANCGIPATNSVNSISRVLELRNVIMLHHALIFKIAIKVVCSGISLKTQTL